MSDNDTKRRRIIHEIDDSIGLKSRDPRDSLVPPVIVPPNERPNKPKESLVSPPLPPNAPPELLAALAQSHGRKASTSSEAVEKLLKNLEKDDEIEEPEIDDLLPIKVNKPLNKNVLFAERIIPPSNCIFYDFSDIQIRPFNVPDLARYALACKRRDPTMVYDIIDSTLDVDVRDLWPADFRFILYWLKTNSITSVPHKLRWTSIYRNKNVTEIRKTNIEINYTTMTEADYADWQAKGMAIPTIRLQEEFESKVKKLAPEDVWLMDYAQFVIGSSVDEKIEKIKNSSPDFLFMINDFKKELTKAGLVEKIPVRDAKFDLIKAIEQLRNDISSCEAALENEENLNEEEIAAYQLALDKRIPELTRLLKYIDDNGQIIKPGEAEPMLETRALNISLYNIFPEIL